MRYFFHQSGTTRLMMLVGLPLSGAACGCACSPESQVVGETIQLERDALVPEQSAFAEGSRVSLRAVRGETLGLQVVVSEPRSVRLDIEGSDIQVSAFEVGYVSVREPSTAMYGPSRGAGHYPDILKPATQPVPADRLAYFDVAISETAAAGRYSGRLSIGPAQRDVELTVEPIRIRLEEQPLVWVFYHPAQIARVHGMRDSDSPEQIAREAQYHDLFRRHGTYLASDLGPSRFPPRRHFMHDVRYWPVGVDASSKASLQRDVDRWLTFFEGEKITPFAIPVDEPRSRSEKARTARVARLIGKAGGGAPQFLRAVTAEVDPAYDDVIDVYFSPENIPDPARARRGQGQRYFTYNGRPPQAGSMVIDSKDGTLRTWGWLAFRYDIELWYAWEGLYFSDRYNDGAPTDVFDTPLTFDERTRGGEDYGNGDGLLAYPGALPSLRLKALRRGLLDRLLLEKLEECGAAETAETIARQTVPRGLGAATEKPAWPDSELEWESSRQRIIDALVRRCAADV